jgi:hypothetical protein
MKNQLNIVTLKSSLLLLIFSSLSAGAGEVAVQHNSGTGILVSANDVKINKSVKAGGYLHSDNRQNISGAGELRAKLTPKTDVRGHVEARKQGADTVKITGGGAGVTTKVSPNTRVDFDVKVKEVGNKVEHETTVRLNFEQ